MQASKWLRSQILIDDKEMEALFIALGDFKIYNISTIVSDQQFDTPKSQFLECYQKYIELLKEGELPDESQTRPFFSSIFSVAEDHLYAMPVGEKQQIIRILKPVIQLQAHKLDYSKVDGKFYSMTFGSDSISWGIQFSYPQLYEDPHTRDVLKVNVSPEFPNTLLFNNLQKWVRNHTIPTPFVVNDKKTNLPVRLGKNCQNWINRHLQLINKRIRIDV